MKPGLGTKSIAHPTVATRRRAGERRHLKIPLKWAWHYRTLLALRDHLAGNTGDRTRELLDPMEAPSLHFEDLADEVYDRDLANLLPADPQEALREIEAALARLKGGTYGHCELTGRRIPMPLLREMPWRRSVPPLA